MLIRIHNNHQESAALMIEDPDLVLSVEAIACINPEVIQPSQVLSNIQQILLCVFCVRQLWQEPFSNLLLYRFILCSCLLPDESPTFTIHDHNGADATSVNGESLLQPKGVELERSVKKRELCIHNTYGMRTDRYYGQV
uniref:Uncharacterized protein n=1 Tax=Spongospora subterranea TaxID=70186 RepID=A0A0H5RDS6_9EUKA|eukprot:CRZ06699.1 hypothetical protein [Spongospora subterranea]